MEKEILSKIYDLKNLIETTIKSFEQFTSNKSYIIDSLTQIEEWIKQYYLNNNSINNIKQKEEIKTIDNENVIKIKENNSITKKITDLNKNNTYELNLNNGNNKNNNNTNILNSPNIVYDNEFNSPVDYRIKYYKSKDYKGNQSINNFDYKINNKKYESKLNEFKINTLKSTNLNSINSNENDINKILNENTNNFQLDNSQNKLNNSFITKEINENENDNDNDTKSKINDLIKPKIENKLNLDNIENEKNKKYNYSIIPINKYSLYNNNNNDNFNLEKKEISIKDENEDNKSNNTEISIHQKNYTPEKNIEIPKFPLNKNLNSINNTGFYTSSMSHRNIQITNKKYNQKIEKDENKYDLILKSGIKNNLENNYQTNRSSSQPNFFQSTKNYDIKKNNISSDSNNNSFNMSLNTDNETKKIRTGNFSSYRISKGPYSYKIGMNLNNYQLNYSSKLNNSFNNYLNDNNKNYKENDSSYNSINNNNNGFFYKKEYKPQVQKYSSSIPNNQQTKYQTNNSNYSNNNLNNKYSYKYINKSNSQTKLFDESFKEPQTNNIIFHNSNNNYNSHNQYLIKNENNNKNLLSSSINPQLRKNIPLIDSQTSIDQRQKATKVAEILMKINSNEILNDIITKIYSNSIFEQLMSSNVDINLVNDVEKTINEINRLQEEEINSNHNLKHNYNIDSDNSNNDLSSSYNNNFINSYNNNNYSKKYKKGKYNNIKYSNSKGYPYKNEKNLEISYNSNYSDYLYNNGNTSKYNYI